MGEKTERPDDLPDWIQSIPIDYSVSLSAKKGSTMSGREGNPVYLKDYAEEALTLILLGEKLMEKGWDHEIYKKPLMEDVYDDGETISCYGYEQAKTVAYLVRKIKKGGRLL